MTQSFASYEGEEILVVFKGQWSKADYGVRGSPVWDELTHVEIEELYILDTKVEPATLSNETLNAIHALSEDICWEP